MRCDLRLRLRDARLKPSAPVESPLVAMETALSTAKPDSQRKQVSRACIRATLHRLDLAQVRARGRIQKQSYRKPEAHSMAPTVEWGKRTGKQARELALLMLRFCEADHVHPGA